MKKKQANTGKIYGAYGSNMNLEQMKHRCPKARVVGTGWLEDYQLVFRGSGVASVIPQKGKRTPVLLWTITEQCEKALDRYETQIKSRVKTQRPPSLRRRFSWVMKVMDNAG